MSKSEAQMLAIRLLELQQRFESYVLLHEEELREIKATLSEIRREVLHLRQLPESPGPTQHEPGGASLGGDEQSTEADERSALLTL